MAKRGETTRTPVCAGLSDTRLLGTWRSDGRRTAKEIQARRDIPHHRRAKLAAIFGHLTLRYTRTRCYSTFHGNRDVLPYRVVAKSADSVVVVGPSVPGGKEDTIHHIRFEELGRRPKLYWVALGSIREYFRRVEAPPNNEMQRTKPAQAKKLRR